MNRSKLNIILGILVTSIIGVTLIFSTLHSHHNLELHNSSAFADNGGQCLTADNTLCPICAHLVEADLPSFFDSQEVSFATDEIVIEQSFDVIKQSYKVFHGRSPPSFA
ncbi:hypothetical protein [Fodinibius sp. SL11]|uniref:hypothetical protein n=1 Tax=Fodinibius sp. SL11 TaxID=3425690 RepID=UPI003F880C08